jgi:hypothetical protein
MVGLLKALQAASNDIATKPTDELVQLFAKDQAFSAEPTDQLTAEVNALKSKYAAGWAGFKITEQQWSDALEQFQDWGIQGYDASFPGYQFDSLIDSTYVDKAAQ